MHGKSQIRDQNRTENEKKNFKQLYCLLKNISYALSHSS